MTKTGWVKYEYYTKLEQERDELRAEHVEVVREMHEEIESLSRYIARRADAIRGLAGIVRRYDKEEK